MAPSGPRKSIGLANLVDAVPLASPARKGRLARRKPRRSLRLLPASKDGGDSVSAASPTTGVAVPTPVAPASSQEEEEEEEEEGGQEREGEDCGVVGGDEPTTPRGSAVVAVALFEAIAQDAFFEVMTRLGVELCGTDEDAQRLRLSPRQPPVVHVNAFKDSTHGKTLLHEACKHASLHVIKCLLYHGASPLHQCVMGRTPFHDVISSGKRDHALEVIQILYEYEPRGVALVDINGTHIVHLAAIHGCLDVIQWCAALVDQPVALAITSFSGRNVLHYAAYNGRLKVLEWLLQDGVAQAPSIASLDVNGYSVLHYAAMGGHLDVCQWLVYCAPSRRDLNIVGTNSGGSTAQDLAKQPELQAFFEEVSQVPDAPSNVECIGTDSSSMGITWTFESTIADRHLREELAPKWFEIEYCKKPVGLRRASAMLSMLMIMPSEAASAAAISASSYLLDWDTLDVFIQPESNEHWLTGLDSDCEYLVRMRTLNRNGYSEYSVPSLSGEFKTTASNITTNGSARKSSFFDLLTPAPPRRLEMVFIGTLDLEILEARRLLYCSSVPLSQQHKTRQGAADQGRFFAVVTLQLPTDTSQDAAPRRRTSLSLFKSDSRTSGATSTETGTPRCLYRMRTEVASVQQDLLLAGSLNAFRHPQFDLHTKLRVPDALDAELILEIHHETPSVQASAIGVAHVPLLDLVRGFPAKMQWLTLEHGEYGAPTRGCDDTHGELLIRSLFRADGITCLPHPKNPGLMCSTAEELLDDTDRQVPLESSATFASTSSSSASNSPTSVTSDSPELSPTTQLKPAKESIKYDTLGFRIWPTHEVPLLRTYEYYRLHQLSVAQQQESLWLRYHHDMAANSDNDDPKRLSPLSSLFDALNNNCDQDDIYVPSESRADSRLRRLVWNGIPPSSRGRLYMRLSGADKKRRAAGDGYYQQQLKRAMTLKTREPDNNGEAHGDTKFDIACKQIQVDLKRTFAANKSWINSSEGEAALERVLLAYAIHNERIGYCQSMSFIAGRLLCMLFDVHVKANPDEVSSEAVEEDAFWLIAALCEDYFPTNYTKGMEGLHVDGLVLETLIQRRLPKVTRHFQVVLQNPPQMGLLLVTGWLLPVFCAVFPSETSARLLDVLFYEGSSVVFALILTFLRMAQPQMIHETKDYMQLFRLLKDRDQRLHDTALLMEIAMDEHLLLEHEIPALRQQCKEEYEKSRRSQELAQLTQQHELQRRRSRVPSTTTYF